MGNAARALMRVVAWVHDRDGGELTVTTIRFVDGCLRRIATLVTQSFAQTC
jgi:hypothetical protein